jgi:two-component system, NtrC family, sensor kinase
LGAAAAFHDGTAEVLRQASLALGGRTVTLYEVSESGDLLPRLSSARHPGYHATKIDLDTTLRRWGQPLQPGQRWVAARTMDEGPWVIAPARSYPAAPPPGGKERRSAQRLTLELAGLCLGLIDRREAIEPGTSPTADPLRDLLTLPSVIAHEARNPLSAARAGLQLAVESVGRMNGLGANERRQLLLELGEVGEAIERTVDFLRAVSDRARGARSGLERFDVVHTVRSAVALESLLLRGRGLEVALESDLDQLYIEGDRTLVYELISNLVRNAADASVDRTAPIVVALEHAAATVRVVVRDRGAGIPAQLLGRVFEPGFTTKRAGEGGGTGLSVVRNIVDGFGGDVRIESVEGQGTTVIVQLPAPAQRGSAEPLPA